MKVLKVLLSTLLLLSVSFFAQAATATEPGKVIVKTEVEGKVINLKLANLQELSTNVQVTTLDGDTAYLNRWIQNHNGYTQNLNLKKLPVGKYKLMVKNNGETYTTVVKVEADRVLLSQ